MKCKVCGKEIPDDSQYCPNCGKAVANLKKTSHKWIIAVAILLCAVIGGILYWNSTPQAQYSKADKAFQNGNFTKAVACYIKAGNYEDAKDKLKTAQEAEKWQKGQQLITEKRYEEAIKELETDNGYEDSEKLIKKCYYLIGKDKEQGNDYIAAAEAYGKAKDYEDAQEKIAEIGEKLVCKQKYQDALDVYDFLIKKAGNSYYLYATGVVERNNKEYDKAADYFKRAGEILDAKDQYILATYMYGTKLLDAGKYDLAKEEFMCANDYKDSKELIGVCDLLEAKNEMNAGNLNTAKQKLADVPKKCTYKDISADKLLKELNDNEQWMDICGTWSNTSGALRSKCNGDYGYSRWWDSSLNPGDVTLEIKCKIADSGKVTLCILGSIPIFTNYSVISEGVNVDYYPINVEKEVTKIGDIKVDDKTTINLSTKKIKVSYKYNDNNRDVFFKYVYTTNIEYGKRESKV